MLNDWIEKIAREYVEAPHTPEHESYRYFCDDTLIQARLLLLEGWNFKLTEQEPYENSDALFADISRKEISIFTGGQNFAEKHPLSRNPKSFVLSARTFNELFRAVHDVYGHGAVYGGTRAVFETFEGELQSYHNHLRHYRNSSAPALYGETIGQLCHYYSGRGFVKTQECKIIPVRIF